MSFNTISKGVSLRPRRSARPMQSSVGEADKTVALPRKAASGASQAPGQAIGEAVEQANGHLALKRLIGLGAGYFT
jgi:hypothetical protein